MSAGVSAAKIAEFRLRLLLEFEWMAPEEAQRKADELIAFLFPDGPDEP